jgi:hypothetical protein
MRRNENLCCIADKIMDELNMYQDDVMGSFGKEIAIRQRRNENLCCIAAYATIVGWLYSSNFDCVIVSQSY